MNISYLSNISSPKFYRKERRWLTLLEMIIAMAMTAVILAALALFYQHAALAGKELDQIKNENFSLRYLENRFMHLLPKILKPSSPDFLFFSIENDPLTLSNSQSLIFTFDHGDHLDKIFSNEVVARLYLDKQKNLILAYWPLPKRVGYIIDELPQKKEILLDRVEAVHFEFYVAPEEEKPGNSKEGGKEGTDGELEQPQLQTGWQSAWPQSHLKLPALIRLIIKRSGEAQPFLFVIPLPNSSARIVYQGGR